MKRFIVPSVVFVAAAIAALIYRAELVAWFTGDRATPAASVEAPPAAPADAVLPAQAYPPPVLAALQGALDGYERIRARLAADQVPEAATGHEVAGRLREALAAMTTGSSDVADVLGDGATASHALAAATDLTTARTHFAELSRALLALAASDPRLQTGWHVFECSMTADFNRWMQRPAEIANPYQGPSMLTCGNSVTLGVATTVDPTEIDHYTCPMHPSVHAEHPGKCPICGMDLTPVTKGEMQTGVIRIDPARRATVGIRTGTVARAPMTLQIRAVGRLTYDETRLHDVVLRVSGFVSNLRIETTGQAVRKGETLFTLYSPELYAAQQEYLLARQSQELSAGARGEAMVRAAEKKLRLWGLSDAQLAKLVEKGEPIENLPFASPASGTVIEKEVVEGDAVEAGMRLFRIAALDRIWVEADVYENDLARITKGSAATIELGYLPGRPFTGKVSFVYPYIDPAARTGRVRIELPNKGLELKPDMYATVSFEIPLGERVQVPASAVVYTGPRRLVFVDLGDGRFRPQEVTIGAASGDVVEIVSGLAGGETVVTSGNFLVAAESRIRSAATYWSDDAP